MSTVECYFSDEVHGMDQTSNAFPMQIVNLKILLSTCT